MVLGFYQNYFIPKNPSLRKVKLKEMDFGHFTKLYVMPVGNWGFSLDFSSDSGQRLNTHVQKGGDLSHRSFVNDFGSGFH